MTCNCVNACAVHGHNVVERLTAADMVANAAYVASLNRRGQCGQETKV
jgi:hypothetical protein